MVKKDIDNLRHSAAHLLAAAVVSLWPEAKPTIGPSIENGFYYDFDFGETKLSEKDLPRVEKKMRDLVSSWDSFERIETDAKKAKDFFSNNPYKLELIEELIRNKEKITFYKSGDFTDLCRGGHVDLPKESLKHFKLLSVAGAYWRGDEKREMLTRIYGTAFATKKELDDYLEILEKAKERDHRKLGRELDLFTFSELVGSGLPLYTAKGALIRRLLNEYIEEEQVKLGYQQVWTPQMARAELFKISGHYDKYKEDMFKVSSNYSDEELFLKPMNCPQHTQIYASRMRSYRDLPIRLSDFAMLYRDEKPGELNGLARVRAFSTDDCHIFCTEEQVDSEVDNALTMTRQIMKTFEFKYRYRLSTRDPSDLKKYLGEPKTWDKVEKWAVDIMKRNNIEYFDAPGEAAFYAPKMDLMATDALGREWQLSTIQIDYVQPERFGLYYIDKAGEKKTPIMIHRAILGSSERAMMILIEHFGGAFPVWLAPVQIKILPVTERNLNYAQKVADSFAKSNIRFEVDERNETLSSKIRVAQEEKIPYMLIIGDREEGENKITVRKRDGDDLGAVDIHDFINKILESIQTRSVEL